MGVSAHYLDIEWESYGIARKVELSTYPVELDLAQNGSWHCEVSIFRSAAPWIGLQFTGNLKDSEPATIDAKGERHPWLPIQHQDGSRWWIPATGWSKKNNCHISEMHRSFGTFQIEMGPYQTLVIDAVANELDRAHAQDYLEDFQDELIWLAIGKPTGALGEAGFEYSPEHIDALEEFATASSRVLENPARQIREITVLAQPSKLRPNVETFRAAVRHPVLRRYPGRGAEECVDVPENRYLRGLVQHCQRLARSIARSSSRRNSYLSARAEREKARATELLERQEIEVDKEIFLNQLTDIQCYMDDISDWQGLKSSSEPDDRRYHFSVGTKHFSGGFFYQNIDADQHFVKTQGFDFSVVNFPEGLHDLVENARGVDRDLTLTVSGKAKVSRFTAGNGKIGRRADFLSISAIQPFSPVLTRRQNDFARYQRNNWRRPIRRAEKQELESEARIALARANQLENVAQEVKASGAALTSLTNALMRQDTAWESKGVAPTSIFPTGMRLVQNPVYAGALAAFVKVKEMENNTAIGGDTLNKLARINILHASAIYERWCLIKIISVLVQDFGFTPQSDWAEHIVRFSTQPNEAKDAGFTILLVRHHPKMTALLDVEPCLANGRRPDFRLRFAIEDTQSSGSRSIFQNCPRSGTGIVMDAKFRTRWKHGELDEMLETLVKTKDYGQDGDRVFILHPAKSAIERRTSPLMWGRDCDYGHRHPFSHKHGSVQLSADPLSPGASIMHLRRLIALELQKTFPEPEFEKEHRNAGQDHDHQKQDASCVSNASFCIACGHGHRLTDVKLGATERGNAKYLYRCSHCGATTVKTPCFGCGNGLFKNGLQMTYHLTIADQVTNVVCPDCGANF